MHRYSSTHNDFYENQEKWFAYWFGPALVAIQHLSIAMRQQENPWNVVLFLTIQWNIYYTSEDKWYFWQGGGKVKVIQDTKEIIKCMNIKICSDIGEQQCMEK